MASYSFIDSKKSDLGTITLAAARSAFDNKTLRTNGQGLAVLIADDLNCSETQERFYDMNEPSVERSPLSTPRHSTSRPRHETVCKNIDHTTKFLVASFELLQLLSPVQLCLLFDCY